MIIRKIFSEKNIHKVFEAGVIIKGVDGTLELIGAALLFFISPLRLNFWATFLTQQELSEDKTDWIANTILNGFSNLSVSAKIFDAFYLLVHGAVKIFLVWGLLKNKLWAYPASIVFLVVFIFYQTYRYTYSHSVFMLALTIFDIILVGLTWHEYNFVKKYKKFPQ